MPRAAAQHTLRELMGDRTREIRKHLMVMVALILVIDAIAIAIFTVFDIGDARQSTRVLFTVLWTVVTLAAVLNGLYRIRLARGARRGMRDR